MKGKLSLTAAVTVVALSVAAPAALAEPGPSSDWFDRTVATDIRDAGATPYVDAFERPDTSRIASEAAPDWFERAAAAVVRDARATPYVDAFERPEVTPSESSPPVAESGSDRAWLDLGIAFAIGLALALGLVAVARLRPNRPLTQ